ncbi:hypothetical protein BDW62DRAFT_108974 [Aspergillus aurantiobrunneus]
MPTVGSIFDTRRNGRPVDVRSLRRASGRREMGRSIKGSQGLSAAVLEGVPLLFLAESLSRSFTRVIGEKTGIVTSWRCSHRASSVPALASSCKNQLSPGVGGCDVLGYLESPKSVSRPQMIDTISTSGVDRSCETQDLGSASDSLHHSITLSSVGAVTGLPFTYSGSG